MSRLEMLSPVAYTSWLIALASSMLIKHSVFLAMAGMGSTRCTPRGTFSDVSSRRIVFVDYEDSVAAERCLAW